MHRKQYLINIIETNTEKAYTINISKIKGIILFICISIAGIIISFSLTHLLYKIHTKYKVYHLKKENETLQKKVASWQIRTDSIFKKINKLKAENTRIWMLSLDSSSKSQYGVGGSENSPMITNIKHSQLSNTELELSEIEEEINGLSTSIATLEKNISTRINKISHYPSIKPIRKGWISSTFGKRKDPFTNKIVEHPGIDICTEVGTNVVATGAGKVIAIRKDFIKNKGYGKYILIDHGFGYKSLYAHLSKILVKNGQEVKRWDIIGLTGNTGKSTSPHIHYGVYHNGNPQDPFNFILE